MKTEDIHIRDPFVLPCADEQLYYMYGTVGSTAWGGKANGFDVYTSRDLSEWEGPYAAFRPDEDFWSDHHHWAPEVHYYRGKYYMFASFKAEGRCRATQILAADHPAGPFVPHGAEPITPADWECLDGTLHVDAEGRPWIVFCHEWLQVDDGEMCAMLLQEDLLAPAGEPIVLFRASEAPWTVSHHKGAARYVTDGPFLLTAGEQLSMIWSSYGEGGYAIGIARSIGGDITGPWQHDAEMLFEKDGGHGMIFRAFDGRLLLALHVPNKHPDERPAFFEVKL